MSKKKERLLLERATFYNGFLIIPVRAVMGFDVFLLGPDARSREINLLAETPEQAITQGRNHIDQSVFEKLTLEDLFKPMDESDDI